MRVALLESNVRGDPASELLKRYYYLLLCEGCTKYDFEKVFPRTSSPKKAKRYIVVASPNSLSEARLYARSKLVDLISFGKENLKYLDESEIELIMSSGKAIEVRVDELIEDYKALGRLRKVSSLLINKEIATSFTCSPASKLNVCLPTQVLSLLNHLRVDEEDALVLWSLATNYVLSKLESKGMRKVLSGDW